MFRKERVQSVQKRKHEKREEAREWLAGRGKKRRKN
jgi:hypothetical protein